MASTDPVFPDEQQTNARGCGFFLVFLVGAGAVYMAIRQRVGAPSVWLELGASVMLFTLLFYLERILVTNVTDTLIENLTGSLGQVEELARALERADSVDYSDAGPVDIASRWLYGMRYGHFESSLDLSDPNWRLCRAQAWLYNNPQTTAQFGDRDEIAQALASGDVRHPLWFPFVETEANQFRQTWKDVDPDTWGVASRRRPTGKDHELVVFVPLGRRRRGYRLHAAALLTQRISLLMHRTEAGWVLAHHESLAPPTPGWPPSWWMLGDPAFEIEPRAKRETQDTRPAEGQADGEDDGD